MNTHSGWTDRIEQQFHQLERSGRAKRTVHLTRALARRSPNRNHTPRGREGALPPRIPVGAKLELTHRCNLLCSFCYTDSPMKTLRREPELNDEQWLAVIDEVIDLGVIEAVLTGGEPLLRKKLTIEAATRLSNAGIAVIVNTNGWFVDEDTAQVLAGMANVRVSVSIDGVTPELHDSARGVPGSWIRAVEGTNRLLANGADVRVNHVVTPTNEHEVEAFVDAMVAFGVPSLRLAGAGLNVGASSREGDWRLDNDALGHVVTKMRSRHEGRIALGYVAQDSASSPAEVPDVFLVRPNGSMVLDSRRPLCFGYTTEPLATAWARVRTFWAAEGASGLEARLEGHIAYRDDDVSVVANSPVNATPLTIGPKPSNRAPRELPLGLPSLAETGDVEAGRATLDAMVGARRYRTTVLRWAGDADGQRSIRTAAGSKHAVGVRAGALLDAFDSGSSVVEAVQQARTRCSANEDDLRVVVADLVRRKLLVPDRGATNRGGR